MSQFNLSPEMRLFLEGLLESNGISFTDEETRERMLSELFVRVDKFLTIMIVNELSEEDGGQFADMLERQEEQEKIQAFLHAKIPDFEAKVQGTLADFRAIYLGQ
jgi:hypothetical protein